MSQTVYGVLIPFLGTSLGAACVFFMRRQFSDAVQRVLIGFAAGVMVAASVWSLLIPAIEQVAWMGKLAFFAGVCRLLDRHFILAGAGPSDSPSARKK